MKSVFKTIGAVIPCTMSLNGTQGDFTHQGLAKALKPLFRSPFKGPYQSVRVHVVPLVNAFINNGNMVYELGGEGIPEHDLPLELNIGKNGVNEKWFAFAILKETRHKPESKINTELDRQLSDLKQKGQEVDDEKKKELKKAITTKMLADVDPKFKAHPVYINAKTGLCLFQADSLNSYKTLIAMEALGNTGLAFSPCAAVSLEGQLTAALMNGDAGLPPELTWGATCTLRKKGSKPGQGSPRAVLGEHDLVSEEVDTHLAMGKLVMRVEMGFAQDEGGFPEIIFTMSNDFSFQGIKLSPEFSDIIKAEVLDDNEASADGDQDESNNDKDKKKVKTAIEIINTLTPILRLNAELQLPKIVTLLQLMNYITGVNFSELQGYDGAAARNEFQLGTIDMPEQDAPADENEHEIAL